MNKSTKNGGWLTVSIPINFQIYTEEDSCHNDEWMPKTTKTTMLQVFLNQIRLLTQKYFVAGEQKEMCHLVPEMDTTLL